MIVDPIKDRHGRSILTVRDQNTFAEKLRQKRLMTLIHLWLVHRFKAETVYYVTPTEDNIYQTEKMKSHGIFRDVLPGGRRDHRRRREPAAHRGAAGARSRGASAVDSQGRLEGAAPRLTELIAHSIREIPGWVPRVAFGEWWGSRRIADLMHDFDGRPNVANRSSSVVPAG